MSKGGRSRSSRRPGAGHATTTAAPARKSGVVQSAASVSRAAAASSPALRPTTPTAKGVSERAALAAKPIATAPKPGAANPTTPVAKSPAASAGSATKPLSTPMRWLGAITSAIPYALVEYVIFLAIVEEAPGLTVVAGVCLIIIAALVFGAIRYAPLPGNRQTWERMLASWTGDLTFIAVSVALTGLGLLAWAIWHATLTGPFSAFSLILLLAAMALVVVAHYRQEAAEAA